MKFVTFESEGRPAIGAVEGDSVVALQGVGGSMREFIAAYDPAAVRKAVEGAPASARKPLSSVRLLQPIPDSGKLVCLGLNYALHAKEGGHEVPSYPALFIRVPTSLIAHGEPMIVPSVSEQLDYEVELMVVIGRSCRHVSEADALGCVFGYTIFNDGSVREYQRKTNQWTAGKNFDRTGPVGPWIVTADELPAGADGLRVRTILNGDRVLQDSDTSDMIFSVARTVSILSDVMTLEPGDMIAMGTPSGVGHARKPQLWLKPGDRIAVEIEGIGRLENPVAAEAA